MTTGSSVKSIAACFGFAAFAVAIVSGLAAGRTLQEILGGAIASLFVCFMIGAIIAMIGERAVHEGAARYTANNTPPESDQPTEDREPDPAQTEGAPA